ncbi:MAG: RpiB/LacA/LacB family sugar-phosphate isomerase [Candidatus Omnitrophica bacterium]|nr:RpiB/LacA/LacB family sugar-phosphate isomerase [Candidatus Omnitrophota bacterium]
MAHKLTIALAADHGGFALKEHLKVFLDRRGYAVMDFGPDSEEPCDYPLFGAKVADAVSRKKARFGIVICKTGFGMAITANKIAGVRSAVCDTPEEARSARRHNDCNVISLAAVRITPRVAEETVRVFLTEKAEGGRHRRRVLQIKRLEKRK